jgi:hypothetical protein
MDVTDGTHAECVQINGTPLGQLNFTHNWMEITLNQSFNFLVTDFYGTIQNVFCDNNVFIGSASSGVISFNNSNAGAQAINCIFTNNYLSRGNGSGGFFYTDNNKPGQGWTCNTYHNNRNWDTNAIIASPSGQT